MPETAAGRASETMLCHFEWCSGLKGPNLCDCSVVEHIDAIEAEARALGRAEALAAFKDVGREVVAQLRRRYDDQWATGPVYLSDVDALDGLLAALAAPVSPSPDVEKVCPDCGRVIGPLDWPRPEYRESGS